MAKLVLVRHGKSVWNLENRFTGWVDVDLSPRGIREMLSLNKPIYEKTAAYGHFGRDPESNGSFSWENTDKKAVFSK